jgi:hypothetical protein
VNVPGALTPGVTKFFLAKISWRVAPILNFTPGARYTGVQNFDFTPGTQNLCFATTLDAQSFLGSSVSEIFAKIYYKYAPFPVLPQALSERGTKL